MPLHASCICVPNKLSSEINFIKKLAYWNSFPTFIAKKIIRQVLNTKDKSTNNAESPGVLTIYISMPYYSSRALSLLKSCLCKIQSNRIKTCSIRFKTQYYFNKIEFYYNTKDKTAVFSNSFLVYNFSCPGCGANYIGKIERTLYERTVEHAWMTIAVLFTNILMTALVFNICLILHFCICHFLRHQHIFKTVTNLI